MENDRLAVLAAVLVKLLAILCRRRFDARRRQNDSVLTGEQYVDWECSPPVFSPLIAWIERPTSSYRLLPAVQESTTILEFFLDWLTFLEVIIGGIPLTLNLKEDVNENILAPLKLVYLNSASFWLPFYCVRIVYIFWK